MINSNQNAIFIAADHAGFKLKNELKQKLAEQNLKIEDLTPTLIKLDDDYPDIAQILAKKITETNGRGILICGSGNGVCLAANKIKGIRAALGYNTQSAKWASEHLNANVLCLAGAILSPEYAVSIVRYWLETPFSKEERHKRRIEKIKKLEE